MDDVKVRISKLSIVAFCSFLLGTISYFGGVCLLGTEIIPEGKEFIIPGVSLIFQVSAFIMSIVDLFKKKRKKILSIVTVILSGLPTVIFLLIILFIQFYVKSPIK